MKTCHVCGKGYPDEYSFCLSDGTPLVRDVIVPEEATVVRAAPRRDRIKTSTILLFILAGVLTLALGSTIGILYHFWPRQMTGEQSHVNEPSPSPSASPRVSEPTKTPEANIRPPSTPAPISNTKPTPAPTPDVDDGASNNDQGTTRITFRRGRVNETVSGSVGDTRSFVLAAKRGQTLSATVRSADGCVSFDGQSPRLNFETDKGDNVITLVNACEYPARFILSVNIR